MANDNFDYRVNLNYVSDGAEKSLDDLARVVRELEKAHRSGDVTARQFREMRKSAVQASVAIGDQSQEWQNLKGAIDNAGSAWKKFNNEAASSRARGVGIDTILAPDGQNMPMATNLTDPDTANIKEARQALAVLEAQNESLIASLRRRVAASDAVKQAEQALAQAKTATRTAQETRGLSELEKAERRVAAAIRERDNAQRQLTRARDSEGDSTQRDERIHAALQRRTSAEYELSSARQHRANVVEREAAKEEAAEQRLEQARERLQKADAELAKANDNMDKGLDRRTRAVRDLSDAEEAAVAARENLNRAEKSGSTEEVTKATTEAAKATEKYASAVARVQQVEEAHTQAMHGRRYAYYDAGRSALVASAAITGLGVATTVAFAEWQTGMSNVRQTNMDLLESEGSIERLEASLKNLAGTIPLALDEFQGLAALAGQLGVADGTRNPVEVIESFTEAMARFGMISDTVSAEEAGESIAKFVNQLGGAANVYRQHQDLMESESDVWNAVAASIAEVGVNSAATDQQVLHTASNLGLVGAQANMTAEEILGLSAGMASFGIPAERSRSAMQEFVNVMNRGVAGINTDNLDAVGRMMGLTADEAARAWEANPSGFVLDFVQALNRADGAGTNMTAALNSMGIKGMRAVPVFATLARGNQVLEQALIDAASGFNSLGDETSTFAARSNEFLDDIASMWQLVRNEIALLSASIGEEFAPAVGFILQTIGSLVEGFREWLDSSAPIVGVLLQTAGVLGVLTAVVAGAVGAWFLMQGSIAGATSAMQNMGMRVPPTIAALFGMKVAADGATVSMTRLAAVGKIASRILGTVLVGALTLGIAAMEEPMTFLEHVWNILWRTLVGTAIGAGVTIATGVAGLLQAVLWAANGVVKGLATVLGAVGLQSAADHMNRVSESIVSDIHGITDAYNGWADWLNHDFMGSVPNSMSQAWKQIKGLFSSSTAEIGDDIGSVEDEMRNLFDQIDALYEDADGFGDIMDDAAGSAGKLGDALKDAQQEMQTLVEYAGELGGVMQRAFDLQFGSTMSRDNISRTLLDMADAAQATRDKVRDLRLEIRDLRADLLQTAASISQAEYFLSIAVEYGDTKRAQQLEAELAKLRAEQAKQTANLADKGRDLSDAEDAARLSLTGSTRASIDNRKSIIDLVASYQEHLRVLAESGMSQADLVRETRRLKAEFIAQATQMGYSRSEVLKYASAFDEMGIVIAHMPRNVVIEFDGNPALTALREFLHQAEQMIADSPVSSPLGGGGGLGSGGGGLGGGFGGLEDELDSLGKLLAENMSWVAIDMDENYLDPMNLPDRSSQWTAFGGQVSLDVQKGMSKEEVDFWDAIINPRGLMSLPSPIISALGMLQRNVQTTGRTAGRALSGELEKAGRRGGQDTAREIQTGIRPLPAWMSSEGQKAGANFDTSMKGATKSTGSGVGSAIRTGLVGQRPAIGTEGRSAGTAYNTGLKATATSGIGASISSAIRAGGNSANSQANTSGRSAGTTMASGLRATLTSGAQTAGRSVGTTLGNSLYNAMRQSLVGKKVLSFEGSVKAGAQMRMFDVGGFTGRGGKYEPAGIVHRGEYVVPKKDVNQRTGLPYADAFSRQHRGARGNYANGGYVTGGNSGSMVVGLDAATIRAIARAIPAPMLRIGNEQVARATNRANLVSTRRGTN